MFLERNAESATTFNLFISLRKLHRYLVQGEHSGTLGGRWILGSNWLLTTLCFSGRAFQVELGGTISMTVQVPSPP